MGIIDTLAEIAEKEHPPAAGKVNMQTQPVKPGEMKGTWEQPPNRPTVIPGTEKNYPGQGPEVVGEKNPGFAGAVQDGKVGTVYVPKSEQKPTPNGPATPTVPPNAPAPVPMAPKSTGPVVANNVQTEPTPISGPMPSGGSNETANAVDMARSLPTGQNQLDPIKEAAASPNFWDSLTDLSIKTGRGILEILGNIGKGIEGKPTITEQRLAREHEDRMQGKASQYAKDYLSLQQGFQQKQIDIENKYQQTDQALKAQIAAATDENTKTQLAQAKAANDAQHAINQQRVDVERTQANNGIFYQYLNLMGQQANTGNFEGFLKNAGGGIAEKK